MNDYFKSYLQYRALAHRFSSPFPDGGHTIDQMLDAFESKTLTLTDENGRPIEETVINETLALQNVCAKLSKQLVRRMEAHLDILKISKREFIEIAVISAIEESERILALCELPLPEIEEDME